MAHNRTSPEFFIVGTGRCGTTLLRKLLAEHPDVYIPRETHWLPILFTSFGMRNVPYTEIYTVIEDVYMAKGKTALERILRDNKLDLQEFRTELFARLDSPNGTITDFMEGLYGMLAERNGASICGDKTPDYGLCMTMLQQLWPGVKFIHIYRDGRDVALSMSKVLSFRYLAAWEINHWFGIAYKKQFRQKRAMVMDIPAHSILRTIFRNKQQFISPPEISIERFYQLWRSRFLRIRDESTRLTGDCYREICYKSLLDEPATVLYDISQFLNLSERDVWIHEALKMIRSGNINKNLNNNDYLFLTEKYARELERLGCIL